MSFTGDLIVQIENFLEIHREARINSVYQSC